MMTPVGSDVQLTPKATGTTTDGAGFGFATTATTPPSAGTDLYLTPVGSFEGRGQPDGDRVDERAGDGRNRRDGVRPHRCRRRRDIREQPGGLRQGFVAGTGQVALTDELTTSWVSVQKSNGSNSDGGMVPTSYCAQPTRSTYFARQGDQPAESFSVAVGISLSDLSTNPLFPMLAYGGVFYEDPANGIENPNPTIAAQTVGDIETQVVEPSRHAVLEATYDTTWGPIFFDATTNTAFRVVRCERRSASSPS